MRESDILYQNGLFWVCTTKRGYEVYRDNNTHAVRVASIGYPGAEGLRRAIAEADKRASAIDSRP